MDKVRQIKIILSTHGQYGAEAGGRCTPWASLGDTLRAAEEWAGRIEAETGTRPRIVYRADAKREARAR